MNSVPSPHFGSLPSSNNFGRLPPSDHFNVTGGSSPAPGIHTHHQMRGRRVGMRRRSLGRHLRRMPQLQRPERQVDVMAGHIRESATAEVPPTTPVERMIDAETFLVRLIHIGPHCGRPNHRSQCRPAGTGRFPSAGRGRRMKCRPRREPLSQGQSPPSRSVRRRGGNCLRRESACPSA